MSNFFFPDKQLLKFLVHDNANINVWENIKGNSSIIYASNNLFLKQRLYVTCMLYKCHITDF